MIEEDNMEVRFEATLVKILRINGEEGTVKRSGGTLRIVCPTEGTEGTPFITVNEHKAGRVIFLANIQQETSGAIHQDDRRVVTMFLIDESFHIVRVLFYDID